MCKILNCPCKDCNYRRIGCSAICKEYKNYMVEYNKAKEYLKLYNRSVHTEGYYNSFIRDNKHARTLHRCKTY